MTKEVCAKWHAEKQSPKTEQFPADCENDEDDDRIDPHVRTIDPRIQYVSFNQMDDGDEKHRQQHGLNSGDLESNQADRYRTDKNTDDRDEAAEKNDH